MVSGQAADRFDRRKILMFCYCGFALCSGLLLTLSWRGEVSVHHIYMVVILLGIVRSFNGPVSRAATAAVGAGRTFCERGGVEFEHPAGRDHSGAGARRIRLCVGPTDHRRCMQPLC